MPSNDPSPPIALLTEVDGRAYRGAPLFDMGGGGVVSGPAADYFEDALNFLNGRCSQSTRDLESRLNVIKGVATWSVYIDGDDKVVIENTGGAFTITVGSLNPAAFGFPNVPYSSAFVLGTNRITADVDWVRGNVQNAHLAINDGATDQLPDVAYRAQDVVTMVRGQALTDADSANKSINLEQQINTAYDIASRRYRWGLNAIGHVWLAADSTTATAPDGAGVWLNNDLQLLLGFDGTEVTQTVADAATGTSLEYIEATYPCQAAIMPTRPLRRPITHRFDEKTNTARLTSGEIASNKVMGFDSAVIEWWLDGPADCRDLSTHWLNAVIPRAAKGVRWALYQVWGDPRRVRFDVAVRTTQAATVTPAYDLLATAELNGRRGRIRGRRSISDSAKKANKWPGSLLRRIPMTTILEDAED